MNSKLNLGLIAILATLSGTVAAEETYWVALSSDVSLDRTSIASNGQGEKSVWIQRNYEQSITLGVDPQSDKAIYPHQSAQIEYVVNCAQGKLNMVAWKLFGGADSMGSLVWASEVPKADANYRYSPGTEEEKAVASNICGTNVGSR